jgi:F0F1-type ATP synthase assembly protein I
VVRLRWSLSWLIVSDADWIARVRRTLLAAVLSALLASCWNAGGKGLLFYCYFRKEECSSMRVHIDRERLDGDAIAFVLIILLIVIAFAY